MINQAAIAELAGLAQQAGVDPVALVEGLKLGSATSAALTLLNTMVTPSTVEHLSEVEALDMELFTQAMADAGVEAGDTVTRGLSGAPRIPELIARLDPVPSKRLGNPSGSADAGAVLQLVLREHQCSQPGWWEEMAACFTSNAIIDMSWFTGSADEFIRQTKARSTDGVWGRHRLSPPLYGSMGRGRGPSCPSPSSSPSRLEGSKATSSPTATPGAPRGTHRRGMAVDTGSPQSTGTTRYRPRPRPVPSNRPRCLTGLSSGPTAA